MIEVGPNRFVSYRMHGVEVSINIEREVIPGFDVLSRIAVGPPFATIEVSGYLDSMEDTRPPAWAEEPQQEIEGRRQLPAAIEVLEVEA